MREGKGEIFIVVVFSKIIKGAALSFKFIARQTRQAILLAKVIMGFQPVDFSYS